MRILTYNVHSCVGTDGLRSAERIAAVIAESNPDVVALQELDHGRRRSRHVHQAQLIAELLEMHFHFHPALRIAEEEYGDAILSRHPLRLKRAGALPTVSSGLFLESRGALWVEIEVEGRRWQVLNTHLGLGRAERLAQAQALLGPDWAGAIRKDLPILMCGDFNSRAGGRVHRLLSTQFMEALLGARRNTFPSRFPMLCLDYVFVGAGVDVRAVEVPRNPLARIASDHLPVMVDVAETSRRSRI